MNEEHLPDAELDVMSCLWQEGPATAREVREALISRRPMSHGAVFTLLSRLQAKRFVTREKGSAGKAFVYRAIVQPGRTYKRILGELLDGLFRGSGLTLIASLLETRPPTATEIDELEKLLADLRARQAEAKQDSAKSRTKKGTRS